MRNEITCFFFKMRHYVMLILLVFVSLPSLSQQNGFREISDLPAFKKKFNVESAKILSIESTFSQEKILMALTEKIVSTGNFWYKRSAKVRIEYTTPFQYVMIMDGDKMILRDSEKVNRVNVKSNRLFQQVNRIIIDCVQGTILDSKDFTTRVYENDAFYSLEMTPTGKALREFFDRIVLIVDRRDYSVKSIEMHEPSGDRTTLAFRDKKINTQISDAVFTL